MGRWHIIAHPERDWIIESGRARCAVSPDLGQALLPLSGQTPDQTVIRRQLVTSGWTASQNKPSAETLSRGLAKILAGPGARRGGPGSPAVWLRVPLVPARVTTWVSCRLSFLTSTPALTGLAVIGCGLYLIVGLNGGLAGPWSPTDIILGLGLFFLLAVFHEFGHAAALSREGYPPGRIGLGVLFIIPVLYADVSAVAVLPRSGKLRVDLAGVCFQLGAGGVLLAAGARNPHLAADGALQLAGLLALPAVAWSLLPFIRADGYWFLTDLLDLPSLEQPAPQGSGRRMKIFLIFHRLANAAFLVLVSVALPLRYHGYLTFLSHKAGIPGWALATLLVPLLAMIWVGMARRLVILLRSCRRDLGGIPHPAFGCALNRDTPNTR